MNILARPFRSYYPLLLSLLMVSLMLMFLLLSQWLGQSVSPTLSVRKIDTLALPPPPPPPSPAQQSASSRDTLSVQVEGQGAQLQKMEFELPPLTMQPPSELVISAEQSQWQSLDVNWNAFDLDALDSLPTLLTPLRINLPKSLSRKGIEQVLIKLDVMIDEQGAITLIDIASNPYPELENEIQKLIRQSRFSPPQKNNEPARARFIWPIEIKS